MSVKSWTMTTAPAYLVLYADAFDDLIQGLAQPLTIVSVTKFREAEEVTFDLPLRGY